MPRSRVLLVVVVALAAFGAFIAYRSWHSRVPEWRVGAKIHDEIGHLSVPKHPRTPEARLRSLTRRFYRGRSYKPAWMRNGVPGRAAKDLADELTHAWRDGLDPNLYGAQHLSETIAAANKRGPLDKPLAARELAKLDVALTRAFLHYASDMLDGQVDPRSIDPQWFTRPRRGDLLKTLKEVAGGRSVDDALEELAPPHEGYRKLREALARYLAIADRGGWPRVPPGRRLAAGARGPRVAILRQRLAAEGDLSPGLAHGDVYDSAVRTAVQQFELRHGQNPDGVVDADVLRELNVPAGSRARQMVLTLERWRWLPASFGTRYILVNVPEFMLHAYEGNQQVMSMRVVVGRLFNRTPIFSDRMTHVIVNPTWNVPVSIVRNEILPALARDPGYLERMDMTVVTPSGQPAGSADYAALADGRLSIRQEPSGDNALGRIKFMFPNQFDVYLHDTPAGALFNAEERMFSHGCIRVERPLDLAAFVLGPGALGNVTAALATYETTTITLPRPLPVHILYLTAWVDEAGHVQLRDDVYGLDRRLDRAIGRRAGRPVEMAESIHG